LSVNNLLKKSLLYLSFESFWKKKPFLIKTKRILSIGAYTPQKIKHTAENAWGNGLGSDWLLKWSLRNGKEGDYRSCAVLRCVHKMKAE